jgi:WD40 repeat protein
MADWSRALKVTAAIGGTLLVIGLQAAEPTTSPILRLETGMHTAQIQRIATDATGRWAVTASFDKTARVWEVATGRLLQVLRPPQDAGDEGKLYAVALSPDGTLVAVSGWTGWDWDQRATIYIFDRASGRLLRRVGSLPSDVPHLAFSPDGGWLAASLGGGGGVHLFDVRSGVETGSDADYGGGGSFSAAFSPNGRRLLTSCDDGQLRLYTVQDGKLGPPLRVRPGGGKEPLSARFSPDGLRVAVGFIDTTVVQVLDAETLSEVARPVTTGVGGGDLSSVAWSADGRYLLAGGRWDIHGKSPVRRWPVADWSRYSDVPLTRETLEDLASLPDGGVLFAAGDPSWGVLDAAGQVRVRQDSPIADLRAHGDQLRLSADGRRVRFGFEVWSKDPHSFDVAGRILGADAPELTAARTTAPGLDIQGWEDTTAPTLNGQPLALVQYEISRSVAIAPDGKRFVLGTEWWLRQFDSSGKELWKQPVPGTAWAVNISGDGRYVVAGYADGTIRWHRLADGVEVLALFPHADRKRWVVWTPEGFFDASPEAESLIGYHLNHGKEHEGEFVSAAQLREKFYQPGLIARRLDADGDRLIADAVRGLGDVRELLAGAAARVPALELLSDANVTTNGEMIVKVKVRDQGGGIGRLIYRIDGVEQQGRISGQFADGTDSRSFTLPQGANRRVITVAATNARGIESPPVRVSAQVRPRLQAAPALHVLAVGVSRYRDASMQSGVRFAAGDAAAVGKLFQDRGKGLFRDVDVTILPDEKATGDGIRAAMEALAGRIDAQDVFILYLAGHGATFEREYYFIPWDAVYTSSAALRQRSLSRAQIHELLAKIQANKTLILLDTCSSGGFGREEGRGTSDKDAIDRLSRLSGRAVIAATAEGKIALEGEGGHGAFTYVILEGLSGKAARAPDGSVTVFDLSDYVTQQLPSITRKWGQEQFPFSSTEGASFALTAKP